MSAIFDLTIKKTNSIQKLALDNAVVTINFIEDKLSDSAANQELRQMAPSVLSALQGPEYKTGNPKY
ncbi:predicted protein [Sclerotinia sclerotiorum 1980 UF-70]|uniref:Uncharacterized protein n=1 Tax=Sclerotinia sclerotiorum (strain ATCC 18683 / 1980 / Ss-1) TaxID=665079 RepID=A7EQT5_SCLS1|nr:predicted protein [Sclerotinia sclerotiorum 1980 UF-70]EDN91827.1 predicted protein [Sclerotinia sclerotiorum 1980 UF-70]